MLYNLKSKTEQDRCDKRYEKAKSEGWLLDMTNKSKSSLNMNSYFHLICAYFGLQSGYDAEYVKQQVVKQIVCPSLFNVEKPNVLRGGEMYKTVESWGNLGHEEQNFVINKFIVWSWDKAKIRLPDPKDLLYIKEVRVEVDRNKQYL